jgi:hypothetical protein
LDDRYSWKEIIIRLKNRHELMEATEQSNAKRPNHAAIIPRWDQHFKFALSSF